MDKEEWRRKFKKRKMGRSNLRSNRWRMRERKKKKWVGEGVEKRKDWEKEGGEG